MTVDDLQMLADNGTISEDDAAKLIKQMKDAKTYIDNIKLGKDNRYWVRMPDNSMISKNDYNKMVAAINKYFRDEDKSKINFNFDDVYKMWLAEKSLKAQDSTRTRNVTDYNRYYANSDFVKKLISSITTDDIDLFIHTHIRAGNLDYKQYSNMSLIVRQVLKFAKKKGLITANPMDNFELAKNVLRKSKKAESVDEVFLPLETKNILNAISDRKNKDYIVPLMIALVFYCGIRNGELTTLKWSDIKNGYLHIRGLRQNIIS